ncbi:hypothetical protein EJ07DRAFT_155431 [Lizonia empirigonia]|nr:hypothetical protein EJ07DRAFT_155431 [Lizonia empirigonia]
MAANTRFPFHQSISLVAPANPTPGPKPPVSHAQHHSPRTTHYAPVSNPEDGAAAQSRNLDGAGARRGRCVASLGRGGVMFSRAVLPVLGGVGAWVGGCGECCGGWWVVGVEGLRARWEKVLGAVAAGGMGRGGGGFQEGVALATTMAMGNRLPFGVAQEEARIALQFKNNAPSNWPAPSKPPRCKEGEPIRRGPVAGPAQAKASTTERADESFDNSNRVQIQDAGDNTCWTCPRCFSRWRKNPERILNLERNGRYYLTCTGVDCGMALVVIKRKDSAVEIVDDLREPVVVGELTKHGKNEAMPGPKALEKVKKRQRITKKLERVKTSWSKSKYLVRRKSWAVGDALGRLTGFKSDSDDDEPDTLDTASSESSFQSQIGPPPSSFALKLPQRLTSRARSGSTDTTQAECQPLLDENDAPSSMQPPDRELSNGTIGTAATTRNRMSAGSTSVRSRSVESPRDRWGKHARGPRMSCFSFQRGEDHLSLGSRWNRVHESRSGRCLDTRVAGRSKVPLQQAIGKLSLAPRRNGVQDSRPVRSLDTSVAGRSEAPSQQTIDKGKQPASWNDWQVQCRWCEEMFFADDAVEDELRQHATDKHYERGGEILCEVSVQMLSRAPADSSEEDDGERMPKCTICPRTFSTDTLRLKHETEAHGKKWAVCKKCGGKFDTVDIRDRHSQDMHPYCRNCRMPFPNKQERDEHEQSVHPYWYSLPSLRAIP